ncbi:MAG: 3D domain-containing protein [Pyrinomonadaceae bacterium]|nr:3D domain-containing protein [Pyrinomonadaceae bacterium]
MKHSLYGGSAIAVALFSLSLIFQAVPSYAEPSLTQDLKQPRVLDAVPDDGSSFVSASTVTEATAPRRGDSKKKENVILPAASGAQSFTATAYCLRGRMASGAYVRKGAIAADRRVLPIGTRVRIEAGNYSGEYTVLDTGGAVRGRIIDVWVPSAGEAIRFGRRKVKLTVLQYGGGGGKRRRQS